MKSYGITMPSKKQYNLVPNDDYDSREPLHPEEAFQHGILFQAKYIGTLDVDKPRSRIEIVSAMRRIRYEFKARGIKKRKVQILISSEGVKILLKKKKKKNQIPADDLVVMNHPVYRIFYVSHDSQDLKIFSYIARDGSSNVFRCHVFKSYKKSQAIRIVRTVGQAFEVCHKLSLSTNTGNTTEISAPQSSDGDGSSNKSSEDQSDKIIKGSQNGDSLRDPALASELGDLVPDLNVQEEYTAQTKLSPMEAVTIETPASVLGNDTFVSPSTEASEVPILSTNTPLSAYHEIQLIREQLNQQQQQTQVAVAQVRLLRDQLAAESAARLEAQSQTHQLLLHNKELLDHIQNLVRHVQDLEKDKLGGSSPATHRRVDHTPHVNIICDPHTPTSPELKLTEMQEQQLLSSLGSCVIDSCQIGVPPSPQAQMGGIKSSIFQFPQNFNSGRRPYSLIPPQSGSRRFTHGETSSGSSESDVQRLESRNTSSELIDTSHLIRQQLDSLSLDSQRQGLGLITRSSSEKVPNSRREEMLSQIQRTGWARHTTS